MLVLRLIWMKVDSDLLKRVGYVVDFEEGGFRPDIKRWLCV